MQARAKNKYGGYAFSAVLLTLLFLFIRELSIINAAVRKALVLCADAIIPSLFPFLILSDLLLSTPATEKALTAVSLPIAKVLHLSPVGGTCFLLGNLFGFPIGARMVAEYYRSGMLEKKEAERLLLFCGNASPFFLIGSVGSRMLSSIKAGVFLYLLQFSLSLTTGLALGWLCGRGQKAATPFPTRIGRNKGFTEIVQSAALQMLYICAYILFFSALSAAFLPYIESTPLAALTVSLLEIGNASAYASRLSAPRSLAFCAFAASFSGLSVYFQTLDCLKDTHLSTKAYLPTKLLCGGVAFFISRFFY